MRIRTVKPDFWKSEDVAELSWDARLVWIGLWNYVEDNGVGKSSPQLITGELFSLDEGPVATLARVIRALDELSARGRIIRYEWRDVKLLYVVGFDSHQRIDRPSKGHGWPAPSTIPGPPASSVDLLDEDSTNARRGLDAVVVVGVVEGEKHWSANADHTQPEVVRIDLNACFEEFWEVYPRKVARVAAKASYGRAVRRAKPETILAAAARYRDDPNRTAQYTAHPTTWLNQGRWDDEPQPERVSDRAREARPSQLDALREMPPW